MKRVATTFVPLCSLIMVTAVGAAVVRDVRARAYQETAGLDLSQPLGYFIAQGQPDSGYVASDRTLAEWALRAWAREADPDLELKAVSESLASIRVYWVTAEQGLYGETRTRRVDGREVAELFVHPDPNALGRDIAQAARLDALYRDSVVYLTCVHELGHAFGLPHTRTYADIMYSFQYGGDFVAYFMRFRSKLKRRDDIRIVSPFSDADVASFRDVVSARRGR